jgi:hypothetical protein
MGSGGHPVCGTYSYAPKETAYRWDKQPHDWLERRKGKRLSCAVCGPSTSVKMWIGVFTGKGVPQSECKAVYVH